MNKTINMQWSPNKGTHCPYKEVRKAGRGERIKWEGKQVVFYQDEFYTLEESGWDFHPQNNNYATLQEITPERRAYLDGLSLATDY